MNTCLKEVLMMKKLNEKIWKKFDVFGQKGFLKIATTNSSIDSIRLKASTKETVPYITRTDSSNGVSRFVGEENYAYGSDDAGCITVGLDTQTAFYQPHKFVTGQNIQVIAGDTLTKDTAHFYVTILKKQMVAKFNWGGNGATLGRMKRLEAMLPISEIDTPDYEYMTNYVCNKRLQMIAKYRKYIQNRISNLSDAQNVIPLTEKEWEPVILEDIFTISSGTRLETRNKTVGNRPFIGAADNNNGVTGFVSNNNASNDRNVLGVNYNGNGMCIGFYHPYECIFSDDVKRFHLKHYTDNAFILLFFKVIILQQKSKFGYLYKFNAERMAKQRLLVPINDKGEPDYEYMEQYAKNMMLKKYKQYLAFLDAKEQSARVQIP